MIGSLTHLIRGAAIRAILDGQEAITRPLLDTVRPWDSLTSDEQRLFARMAEVFAGFAQIRAKWPAAPLAVTETNTQRVTQDPTSAGAWFDAAYAVAKQYGCLLFCSWWGPPASTDPNWKLIEFSAGAPYVGAINKIAADIAA